MVGEAREAARMLAQAAREQARGERICLLAGGETTVTIKGNGLGGRNQELALALGLELEQHPAASPVSVLCLGTDGSDGPTDAAGGLILPDPIIRARSRGLHPEAYLDNNDSYTFLKQADALLVTGPTRTNVMDVAALLIDPS
jgi:hydroxypyruvate reductase